MYTHKDLSQVKVFVFDYKSCFLAKQEATWRDSIKHWGWVYGSHKIHERTIVVAKIDDKIEVSSQYLLSSFFQMMNCDNQSCIAVF
jgi:hypothetical protein